VSRSAIASDVLEQLKACLGPDLCQQYVWARTRGVPPADCNSITTQWIDRGSTAFADECDDGSCGDFQSTLGFRVTLTRVCMGPDQEQVFDWSLEDAEAACFDDHLELLEDCVQCGDWSLLRQTHHLERFRYVETNHDIESDGGGFSAYIEITIVAAECC
jgi:hypothetical protein